MTKEEARVTPFVNRWFRKNCPESAPFEIKHTKESIHFAMNDLEEHQVQWLTSCSSEVGCIWKIPDANIGHNPFDCFFYKNSPAYVVIMYPTNTVAILIEKIIKYPHSHLPEHRGVMASSFHGLTKDIMKTKY